MNFDDDAMPVAPIQEDDSSHACTRQSDLIVRTVDILAHPQPGWPASALSPASGRCVSKIRIAFVV
jgi:hypothetical protein